MNGLLLSLLLLAQNTRAEQFTKGFRAGNASLPLRVLLPLAIVGLVVATAFYIAQRFSGARPAGPVFSGRRLFQDLCHLHRLDVVSIRLLQTLARQEKLADEAEVFVRPDLFQTNGNFSHGHVQRQRLREKLFGGAT